MEISELYSKFLSYSRLGIRISIEDLSKRVNINRNTIYQYENGKKVPNLKIALALARELRMSLDILLKPDILVKELESLNKLIDVVPVNSRRKSKYQDRFYTSHDIAVKIGVSDNVIRRWDISGRLKPDYIDPITKTRLYDKNRIEDLFTMSNYIIENKKLLVYSSNLTTYDVLHLKLPMFNIDVEYSFEQFIEKLSGDYDGILLLNKVDLLKFKEWIVNGRN